MQVNKTRVELVPCTHKNQHHQGFPKSGVVLIMGLGAFPTGQAKNFHVHNSKEQEQSKP